jgi:hypothetical protein
MRNCDSVYRVCWVYRVYWVLTQQTQETTVTRKKWIDLGFQLTITHIYPSPPRGICSKLNNRKSMNIEYRTRNYQL